MALFVYKGRSVRGALMQGQIDANSIDTVATQLMNSGITPIDITPSGGSEAASKSVFAYLQSWPPGLDDLILFSRQMYTLMKAGVPLVRSILGLTQSTRNLQMVDALKDILTNIESGRDLSSSLARHPGIFSSLFISMVRVGEETGRLDESFLRIAEYLAREKDTRERIKTAFRYPVFVILAIGIALTIINIWVIPAFADLFAKADVPLPWQTRLLLAISAFFVQWWPVMLGGIIAGVFGFRAYTKTENGRYNWDQYKLRLPLVGDIILRATLARFARAFSMSLTSGVPLIQAMTVVARSVDNEFIAEHILSMRNGIERGESLTRTAAVTNMFTPLVLQMMAVGEETGQVDELLAEVADFYEREVDYDIKNLSASIEPIMIVVIGFMVLILALGVFLPMWDLATVIR
ncbi:MAG: MSHA biogenesis protein MshG [Gammaproteobacteria bacterium RIFCSPLOWO2_02_FULL_47_50]|nr:MAG: MSHA biogenesis protein MshG [Gammaproteobacteria bacterium RIFCSPLOWO2_01_FULL_47_190]OGT75330.1 MAG: MSHA biogenesis protein MshG [Gammaproteobacteria bacterium RIFCSPLOWO2_12_47_11]OGT81658.1 MAG: MSHA biogenesis protein MshG [Gammaproteobacteria bacterium RIFCSPLOWO2_02_FULL_47_50]OGT85005.1 MAG: MSHA biogenesis protein MshG [Gammaproteobacteria bacterium RIFCSPLOWO2_12_FULL_47_76]